MQRIWTTCICIKDVQFLTFSADRSVLATIIEAIWKDQSRSQTTCSNIVWVWVFCLSNEWVWVYWFWDKWVWVWVSCSQTKWVWVPWSPKTIVWGWVYCLSMFEFGFHQILSMNLIFIKLRVSICLLNTELQLFRNALTTFHHGLPFTNIMWILGVIVSVKFLI